MQFINTRVSSPFGRAVGTSDPDTRIIYKSKDEFKVLLDCSNVPNARFIANNMLYILMMY